MKNQESVHREMKQLVNTGPWIRQKALKTSGNQEMPRPVIVRISTALKLLTYRPVDRFSLYDDQDAKHVAEGVSRMYAQMMVQMFDLLHAYR